MRGLERDMAGNDSIQMWSFRVEIADPGDIVGYAIHALDGDIGKVDKHDIDTDRSYLLVTTGPWIFGKTVMLPAGVIERVDHEHKTVYVARTKEQIKGAPEYDEGRHDDEGYRADLAGYYGGPAGP
jgi:hypothetical protein